MRPQPAFHPHAPALTCVDYLPFSITDLCVLLSVISCVEKPLHSLTKGNIVQWLRT